MPHGQEYADFHALRHSFVSALAAAGVGQKELQELARHSDPRLTLGLYTHTTTAQLAGAVGKLAIPGAIDPNPLAKFTRADLEAAVAGLLGVTIGLASLLPWDTPRDTPGLEKTGDDRRQMDTTPLVDGAKKPKRNRTP